MQTWSVYALIYKANILETWSVCVYALIYKANILETWSTCVYALIWSGKKNSET